MAIMYHMLIRIFRLIGFIIIYSCAPIKERAIQGQYITKHFSLLERLRHPFTGYVSGMKLDVKTDSTFHFESCGSIWTGTWKVKQDSLILRALTCISKVDSSQLKNGRNNLFVYAIKNNGELHREIYFAKKGYLPDYLMKVEVATK